MNNYKVTPAHHPKIWQMPRNSRANKNKMLTGSQITPTVVEFITAAMPTLYSIHRYTIYLAWHRYNISEASLLPIHNYPIHYSTQLRPHSFQNTPKTARARSI